MAIPKVGSPTDIPEPVPSVDELCISFWRHAEQHYGKSTSEVHCYRLAIKLLRELYGRIPAKDFGPLGLKAVRAKMMGLGSARGNITVMVGRLRRTFKHAVENEMVDAAVPTQLQAAAPLLAGRTEARDNALRRASTMPTSKPFVSVCNRWFAI